MQISIDFGNNPHTVIALVEQISATIKITPIDQPVIKI